ncbi:MAG: hypothetical protein K2X99_02100 [Gemmatimonadaceae bacterium]|nr:hypothetical protein [Gemmatimonadaceae bacterium]
MYTHCLHCHSDLGTNDAIEHFPVGRRLAFDEARGRLWAICRRCGRWNLSPVDERLEAIEECEKAFRATRLRMSTDNIGLGRISEGLELVRVGEALRPEMAAWRYGAQLQQRRRNHALLIAGGVIGAVGLYGGFAAAGVSTVAGNYGFNVFKLGWERLTRIQLPNPDGGTIGFEGPHAKRTLLQLDREGTHPVLTVHGAKKRVVVYSPEQAAAVAPKVFAKLNRSGYRKRDEEMALKHFDVASRIDAPNLFAAVAKQHVSAGALKLEKLPASLALALEMAVHEDRERVALAGELLDLEVAWREAEELAMISDSLVPSSVENALAALKSRLRGVSTP